MKKQLLIAAVAASMTSVAMADISINGSSKVNAKGGDYSMEADVTVTGKSGDTSGVAQIGLDNSNTVEQLYATSSIAGVAVKAGTWKGGKCTYKFGVHKGWACGFRSHGFRFNGL